LAQKIINTNFSGGFDWLLRLLTSCISSITTPTLKKEYKLDPWGGEKTKQINASLCY
jgi:hypothetical protein